METCNRVHRDGVGIRDRTGVADHHILSAVLESLPGALAQAGYVATSYRPAQDDDDRRPFLNALHLDKTVRMGQTHRQGSDEFRMRAGLSGAFLEAVAHPANGLDEIAPEFLAKVADVDIDDVRTGVVVVTPDVAQQLLASEDLPGVPEEQFG